MNRRIHQSVIPHADNQILLNVWDLYNYFWIYKKLQTERLEALRQYVDCNRVWTRSRDSRNHSDGPIQKEVETADKPGSVVGDHPSWTHVTMRL